MRPWLSTLVLAVLVACGHGSDSTAPASPPPPPPPPAGGTFTTSTVVSGLASPTAMALLPDGRILVCEKGGDLRVVKGGVLLPNPFLVLAVDTLGERGLIGVTTDPAFAQNGFVYVYYTTDAPTVHNRISRFTAAGDQALAGSELILLDLNDLGPSNHNGGALHFGPDGKLYAGVGENGVPGNAQLLTNLLGKLLRLNPDGSVPSDNPLLAQTTGKNQVIWAYGLRNPYTFAFEPGTGLLFINDVGQNLWEEIDKGQAGANYGWPTTEGATADPAFVSPLYTYPHNGGTVNGCAIVGGAFYDPATLSYPATFLHKYLFMDFCGGWVRTLDPATGSVSDWLTGFSSPVDVRVADDGSVLVLSQGGGGTLQRVTYMP